MFATLCAIVLGIIAGTITGITPGIHLNLVAALTLANAPLVLQYTTIENIVLALVAMATTHTFLDSIPSTYLGVAESEKVVAALPAQQLLLAGRGYEAVALTTKGSLYGAIVMILLAPLLIKILPNIYSRITWAIPTIILVSAIVLILQEKKKKEATITFLFAAALGCLVLTLPEIKDPLLPLFSGLFGVSTLLMTCKDKPHIPLQTMLKEKSNKKETAKTLTAAISAGLLAGTLPGIGNAQIATLATAVQKTQEQRQYLILTGALGTATMVLSFITLYSLEKARNGAVVAIAELIPKMNPEILMNATISILLAALTATIITLWCAKRASSWIQKVNYQWLCKATIAGIILLTLIITGLTGILILITATAIGILPQRYGVARSHLMACLIIPTIFYLI